MKYIAEPKNLKSRYFIIKHDPSVGFYLYVYENGQCIRDYLQDTLILAKDMAFEDFQVPHEAWKQLN
jgi:hypothetical protein